MQGAERAQLLLQNGAYEIQIGVDIYRDTLLPYCTSYGVKQNVQRMQLCAQNSEIALS